VRIGLQWPIFNGTDGTLCYIFTTHCMLSFHFDAIKMFISLYLYSCVVLLFEDNMYQIVSLDTFVSRAP
jgi:hypothetical protein